jgi:hypothetical protein
MLSTYTGICTCIESDFSHFYQVSLVDNVTKKEYNNPGNCLLYSSSENCPYDDGILINSEYGFIYNHESPGNKFLHKKEQWSSKTFFVNENYKEFRNRYNKRIQNFRHTIDEAIKENITIIFILYTSVTPLKLCDIIKKKFPKLIFKIVCKKIEDIVVAETLNNFEKEFCKYKPIQEDTYNHTYSHENIIMNGWDKVEKYKLLSL